MMRSFGFIGTFIFQHQPWPLTEDNASREQYGHFKSKFTLFSERPKSMLGLGWGNTGVSDWDESTWPSLGYKTGRWGRFWSIQSCLRGRDLKNSSTLSSMVRHSLDGEDDWGPELDVPATADTGGTWCKRAFACWCLGWSYIDRHTIDANILGATKNAWKLTRRHAWWFICRRWRGAERRSRVISSWVI